MISIIITAYNVEQYIEKAMRSALDQTHKDIEVVVVLDKPTDNTEKIVRAIATQDKRVKVVSNDVNVGAGLSRRCGIQASKGEYVLLLDGDDYLHPDFVESLYNKAIETGAEIVSGGIEVLQEDGVRNITLYGEQVCEDLDKVARFWGERVVFMNNKLIHRSLHEKIVYCHRRYIEDTPVIIPQLWLANKVAYVDNAGYVYRMQKDSLTHSTTPFKDIVYKGLCWCDLMEFFEQNDKRVFDVVPIKNYIGNTIKLLNEMTLTADMVRPYVNEWAEFTMRMVNLMKITGVNFK